MFILIVSIMLYFNVDRRNVCVYLTSLPILELSKSLNKNIQNSKEVLCDKRESVALINYALELLKHDC